MHSHSFDELRRNGRVKIALVGSPNVGKSALFYRLTGKYAWVSNYPGTTVEITVGEMDLNGRKILVIDTPGIYSLIPSTEEEYVTLKVLLEIKPSIVVHVVEAKNIREMLPLTLMLLDAGLNTILVVNAVDEAKKMNLSIDFNLLKEKLRIPVVPTVAVTGEGIEDLKKEILALLNRRTEDRLVYVRFPDWIEEKIKACEEMLQCDYIFSRRMLSILALLGEEEILKLIASREADGVEKAHRISSFRIGRVELLYLLRLNYKKISDSILAEVLEEGDRVLGISDKISELMIKPITGIPILFFTLILFYIFVGLLGAQIVVDYLEGVFEEFINPSVNYLLAKYLPHPWIYELIGGEYGIITLGLRYALSIILPVVAFFFIAFSIVEDSGYLPRLALLIDNFLKKIGLSGRAIIPLVLGFGCDTMATITTRTLENKREKLLTILILALGIPCSAQLGVIMSLLPDLLSLFLWMIVVLTILSIVTYSASKLLPGERPFFIMELPPLRLPRVENVLLKTWTRLEWYLKEVIPLFVLASVLIWLGRITGVFELVISILAIPTTWIGLPREAAVAFLYGFFRRDYGAAGFYDLKLSGFLNKRQTLVAMVTITLFVPCIAQFAAMIKERGLKTALAILYLIIPLAFLTGYFVNLLTLFLGF